LVIETGGGAIGGGSTMGSGVSGSGAADLRLVFKNFKPSALWITWSKIRRLRSLVAMVRIPYRNKFEVL
jgi:hypothetical protein